MDYSKEPTRILENYTVQKGEPFNAEPKLNLLIQSFLTPTERFFKRNHGPIPQLEADQATVIQIEGKPVLEITAARLQQDYPAVTIIAALECAGNRRLEMAAVKKVKGVLWDKGTIGNASWTGVYLSQVLKPLLKPAWYESEEGWTVEFEAFGQSEEQPSYVASLNLARIMNPSSEVILAWGMNDAPLSRDHGFPLRVVAPGIIGARSVKWLAKVNVFKGKSNSFYQQRDYKLLPPQANEHNLADWWDQFPELEELNVQSVICDPLDGAVINSEQGLLVRGYALSGGGRGIQRVEVKFAGEGQEWHNADLFGVHQAPGKKWSWILWSVKILPPFPFTKGELICRAWDEAGNTQPETCTWNYRGVMNNAWHRVKITTIARGDNKSLL